MSVRERARVVQRARAPVTCARNGLCSMLTEDHRCGVYDIRPMLCRLWGLVKRMPCPYGCRPEGGLLDDREGLRLMLEADRIGGSPGADERQLRIATQMLEQMSEAEMTRLALDTLGRGRATVAGRLATLHRVGVRNAFEQPGVPYGTTAMAYPTKDENDER